MGEIKHKVTITGLTKSVEIEALFDSGSTLGHIDEKLAQELGLLIFPLPTETDIADGRKIAVKPALGQIEIDGCKKGLIIGVTEKSAVPLTIGYQQMQTMDIKLDPKNEKIIFECKPYRD